MLVNPLDNLPGSFERLGATLENAARLHKAGVTFAFMTGDAHNARNIRQAAGNAVAYGLPWDAALAAMTTVPARIWGIADRYGTLEPGKDADVVVWDGDPLEVDHLPRARLHPRQRGAHGHPAARAARPLQGPRRHPAARLPPEITR